MQKAPKAAPDKEPKTRGKGRFTQAATRRLIQSVLGAGLPIARVEQNTDAGIITVFPGAPAETAAADTNAWDSVLTK